MIVTENIFPIEWQLSDKLKVPYHGKKVFGTFVCGGGSTMGYKLAGYDHLGGVEFLEHYANVYKANHNPKYFYLEDIRAFNKRRDLPDELYALDLLDGSPPCAAFSSSGSREKVWSKQSAYENKKIMKDDLVFVYCETIKKLRPKVFLLENVAGLIKGNAKAYVRKILDILDKCYKCQVFLLNAASMGIPQIRSRTFIIGVQKKYDFKKLELNFQCKKIDFGVTKKHWNKKSPKRNISPNTIDYKLWDEIFAGDGHEIRFGRRKVHPERPSYTLLQRDSAGAGQLWHHIYKRGLNEEEIRMICAFPLDYNFVNTNPISVMGRSVLPVMMANISYQIYRQWLSKI